MLGRGRNRLGLCIDLPLEAIEERVDHDVGLVEAEPSEKALDSLARRANEDSPGHVLIGSVAEHVIRYAACPALVLPCR